MSKKTICSECKKQIKNGGIYKYEGNDKIYFCDEMCIMKSLKKMKKLSKKGKQFVANKKAGRKYQRKIAIRLGGKSVGTIEGQDIEHPVFSMECKKFKSHPAWLTGKDGLWSQCLKNCPKGKVPLALIHQTGKAHEDDLVIMRLEDFENLIVPSILK